MGCATAALEPLIQKRAEAGKPIKGVVYYHKQDAEYFEETRGTLMIRFGAPSNTDEDITMVAQEAVETFQAAGIPTTWDREIEHCIEIDLDAMTAGTQ
jgi:hypothetical protein